MPPARKRLFAPASGPRRLTTLRERAGLSQNALSTRAGLTSSHLSRYESGEHTPRVDILARICTALGVSLAEFDGLEWGELK